MVCMKKATEPGVFVGGLFGGGFVVGFYCKGRVAKAVVEVY